MLVRAILVRVGLTRFVLCIDSLDFCYRLVSVNLNGESPPAGLWFLDVIEVNRSTLEFKETGWIVLWC